MVEDIFELVQKYIRIGQEIELTLADMTEHVRGQVLELTKQGIVLETQKGILFVNGKTIQTFLVPKNTIPKEEPTLEVKPLEDSLPSSSLDALTETKQAPPIKEEFLRLAFDRFRDKATIPLPEPDFKIDNLSKDDQSELNRFKNKYDYALKIHELNRLHDILPELSRLSERVEKPDLFFLVGLVALKIDKISESQVSLERARRLGSRKATLALANMNIVQGNFSEAAELLIQAFFCDDEATLPERQVILTLGYCLSTLDDREIRGLAAIASKVNTSEGRDLFPLLLAFGLEKNHSRVVPAALKGDLEQIREIFPDSPIFASLASLPPPLKVTPYRPTPIPQSMVLGHISAFYPERGYGFIIDSEENTYFFRIDFVNDSSLRQELNANRIGQKISFFIVRERDIGTRYDKAREINLIETSEKATDLSLAITQTRLQARLATVPKDNSTYANAKRIELLGDLTKAEEFYRQVISEGQIIGRYYFSSIMDLAQLLSRLGRDKEAIDLLDYHRHQFTDTNALDRQKANYFVKNKEYAKAAIIVRQLQQKYRGYEMVKLARQEAYYTFMAGNRDKALKVLEKIKKEYPRDDGTLKMIEMIEGGMKFGKSDEEELGSLAGISGLSAYAQELINSCDFSGLDERSKARGFFVKKDFREVEDHLAKISGRRPRDKAKLALTLAAMAQKSPEAAGNSDTRLLLGRSLSFMGEAATYESFHRDTARFYLSEALSLIIGTRFEIRYPLVYLLATYLSINPAPGELLSDDKSFYDIKKVFNLFREEISSWRNFLNDFSYYFQSESKAADLIISEINSYYPILAGPLPSSAERENLRVAERDRLRNERISLNTLATQDYTVAGNFHETASILFKYKDNSRFELDRDRLSYLGNTANESALYWNEQDFIERESKYLRIINDLKDFSQEIVAQPTRLSFESLLPIAERFTKAIEANFKEYVTRVKPELHLSNILLDDYYIPDTSSRITLRLELSSSKGGAPVEGMDVCVHEDEDLLLIEPGYCPGILRGGERREVEIKIKPSAKQLADQAFTIRCYLKYRSRSGTQEQSSDFPIPVRIGDSKTFVSIPNPYKEYAGGKSVVDPKMFMGREELLKRILGVVTQGLIGQCFVLYGQKRSGKTSILHQLQRLIQKPCMAVEVTIGAVDVYDGQTNFIQLCLDRIEERIENELGVQPQNWPSKDQILRTPNECFRNALRQVLTTMNNQGLESPRLILLIDEFTYLYEYITEGMLSPIFMKNWKALLQMQLFNAVVVGQDSMPKFKEKFPNEFGVTYDERISYLPRPEATHLADDLIRLNGASRYRGHALERLLDLTAGSPFYTNILCDRLVDYLNEVKSPFITEADIERIAGNLTSGPEALPIERFDPLITAAGESVAEASRDIYLKVLSGIAAKRNGALLAELPPINNLEYLLKDLVAREVIMVDAAKRYSIRVGLFTEWLRVNDIMMGVQK